MNKSNKQTNTSQATEIEKSLINRDFSYSPDLIVLIKDYPNVYQSVLRVYLELGQRNSRIKAPRYLIALKAKCSIKSVTRALKRFAQDGLMYYWQPNKYAYNICQFEKHVRNSIQSLRKYFGMFVLFQLMPATPIMKPLQKKIEHVPLLILNDSYINTYTNIQYIKGVKLQNFSEEELEELSKYPKEALTYAQKAYTHALHNNRVIPNPFSWFVTVLEHWTKNKQTPQRKPEVTTQSAPRDPWDGDNSRERIADHVTKRRRQAEKLGINWQGKSYGQLYREITGYAKIE